MKNIKILNSNGTMSRIKENSMPISDYADYFIPILNLFGSTSGMTKDDTVTLKYIYREMSGTCTIKWQGSSSVGLPKKNFTIKFDQEFEVVSGWGAQKKYCLKANYVDRSHARNIICAKLWGQIVKSRTPSNARLNALPNGGAIDGFPIILSINGEFQGIYTWNIPKDDWMFGMDGTGQQAIVCAELNNNGAVAFKGLATLVEDSNGQLDFDLEYSSDDQSEWVLTSLNRLIGAVMDSDGTNITYGITPYLDWESAIDYYCHAVLTGNYDGLFRNYLLATYDGIKWFFTGYDMDVVLGLRAMGRYFYPASHDSMSFTTMASRHKVFELIWKYMRPQLRARYEELRASIMSVENVANMFVDFIADIPLPVYVDDVRKWNTIPSSSANNLAQIITYYDLRCRNADEWIKSTSGQTTLPEQVNPNTPTLSSISATYTGGSVTVGTSLTSLNGITVTATYSDGSTANVTGYSLSGAIEEGTNTITVTYDGLTTTFTVTGVAEYNPNKVPTSIDTDGSVLNGVGYVGQTRLSSSGATKSNNYTTTTGFISAKANDVIRIAGGLFSSGGDYVCTYDSNFSFLTALNGTSGYGGGTIDSTGEYPAITLPDNASIAYIRVSSTWSGACDGWNDASEEERLQGPCERLIVTVNEEIV